MNGDMKQQLQQMKTKLAQYQGRRDLFRQQLKDAQEREVTFQTYTENAQKARAVVQIVAEQTQKKIEYHFSNLVSLALASIFPDPYVFELRFVQRRGKTEGDFIFIKNSNETDPLSSAGGGPIDVTSYALRTAVGAIKKTRNVQLLDEPFRFVSRDLQSKASAMLKMFSEKMGVQLIVISHIQEIIDSADTIFEVKKKEGISQIKRSSFSIT